MQWASVSLKLRFIISPFFVFFCPHFFSTTGAGSAAWYRRPCSLIRGTKCNLEGHLLGPTGPVQWQLYHLKCPQLLPEQPRCARPRYWRRILCLCWLSQPLPLLCQVISFFPKLVLKFNNLSLRPQMSLNFDTTFKSDWIMKLMLLL